MTQLFLVLCLTLVISLLAECFIKPSSPTFKRHYSSYIIHFALISVFYLLIALIAQRAIFASLFVLITHALFMVVSNAKYAALKEPLVFSDIVMFSQAFKYPRLYFPFLGWLPIIAAPLIIITAIVLVIRFEPALELNEAIIIVGIVIFSLVISIFSKQQTPTLDIAQDIQQYGFVSSLIIYQVQSRQPAHQQSIKQTLSQSPWADFDKDIEHKQDIIVVQSESFFDARRLYDGIDKGVLKHFDQCCKESRLYGSLKVDAWGANTMRTEFSFLSALGFDQLGFYRFYPYHYLIDKPVVTLASYLQDQGYHTVCIHPHHAEFFGRAALFPQLGFDEFLDSADFDENETFGPYIADQAVTQKILKVLQEKQNKPCFIFAITMENHGPLHLEKSTAEDISQYYSGKPLKAENDLTVYLRHLANADAMIQQLTQSLKQRKSDSNREATLCWYGDHIPSLPAAYAEVGFVDNRTDYFVWNTCEIVSDRGAPKHQDIAVKQLSEILLSLCQCSNGYVNELL